MPLSEPPPAVDAAAAPAPAAVALTPAAVWPALLDAITTRPGLAWIRNLQLRSIDESTASLSPRPGVREAANFAAQPRSRDTLEHLLQQVTGRRLRVEIDHESAPGSDPGMAPEVDGAAPSSDSPLQEPTSGTLPRVQRGLTREEREAAMNLPTVKELQQLFDVTLIDAKPDTKLEEES